MSSFFRKLGYALLAISVVGLYGLIIIKAKPKPVVKPIIHLDKALPTVEFIATNYVRSLNALQQGNRRFCSGSNISYKGKHYILTNMHCCAVGRQLGNEKQMVVNNFVADVIKIDDKADLCVLKSDKKSGIEVADTIPKPLDKLTLIGHPRGMPLVIREGRIIGDEMACVFYGFEVGVLCRVATRISALAYPGNSGSPVLNESMELIGVLFAGDGEYPNEPIIVPLDQVKRFLDSL